MEGHAGDPDQAADPGAIANELNAHLLTALGGCWHLSTWRAAVHR
jgi:hypothetical protein